MCPLLFLSLQHKGQAGFPLGHICWCELRGITPHCYAAQWLTISTLQGLGRGHQDQARRLHADVMEKPDEYPRL